MRLVLISDTHERTLPIPEGDILIHAGDLTMLGKFGPIVEAGKWLRSLECDWKVVIAGNHDYMFERNLPKAKDALGMGITYLQNSAVNINGINIWGSPVSPRFFDWAFNVDRGEAIKKYWDRIPENLDVLITHGPPAGILDQSIPGKSENCGCADLLEAVKAKKPKIHVFGHIHGGYGFRKIGDTSFYNASVVNEAYRVQNEPFVIDI